MTEENENKPPTEENGGGDGNNGAGDGAGDGGGDKDTIEKVERKDGESDADYTGRLEAGLNTAIEQMEKIDDKKVNFKKVREQGKEKDIKHGEEKAGLQEQIDDLKTKIGTNETNQVDNWKNTAIKSVVGSDETQTKAIQTEFDLLNMPSGTKEEVLARTEKAIKMAGFEIKGDLSATPFGGGGNREPIQKDTKYSDTEKGKKSLGMLAPDIAKAQEAKENKDK